MLASCSSQENAAATNGETQLRATAELPVVEGKVRDQFKRDLASSVRAGMRPRVFAKLGDSNIASFNTIYGLGCFKPAFDRFRYLEKTWARYRSVRLPAGYPVPWGSLASAPCARANSFSRFSAATRSGFFSNQLLTQPRQLLAEDPPYPGWAPDPVCPADDTITKCEIDRIRPRYSIISIGVNDQAFLLPTGRAAVERFGGIVSEVRRNGSIPILSTIPPHLDSSAESGNWNYVVEINQAIVSAARSYRVPLINVWRPLASKAMVNFGMEPSGLHLETLGGYDKPGALRRSVDFRPRGLKFGNNRRNLMILQALRRLDREVAELGRSSSSSGPS